MPIEIKEISIKADVYPGGRQAENSAPRPLQATDIERLKQEITAEVLQALSKQLQDPIDR